MKIPPNELRIGNIAIRNGAEFKILYGCDIDHVEYTGIPITEEKLLSLGLIKDATLFRPVESIHKKCQGDIGFKCPSFFFNSRLNRWMDCQTRVCVDYVHQVQNLVYHLTGEELTPITK